MRYFVNDDNWSEMIVEQRTQTIVISKSGGEVKHQSIEFPVVMDQGFKEIDELTAIDWKETILRRLKSNILKIDEAFTKS